MSHILSFASDYQEGAHEDVINALCETNLLKSPGYGTDEYCASARDKIRKACGCIGADVHFLMGGTQTNATVIDALLKSYQGVVAPESGHISVHEAGAIELCGHKVITLPHKLGKISADDVLACCLQYADDENHDHMVMPGMVYISQPTEYGTLYSLSELTAISKVCRSQHIPLYVDGARLAYALACEKNDVTLADLARLCDVFYIGGTKCGALFGEAVVVPDPNIMPHFFTVMKQHGALLAKGRLLGIQFDTLFSNGLYMRIGMQAIKTSNMMRKVLRKFGYRLAFDSPTNQVFVVLNEKELQRLSQIVEYSFWEKCSDNQIIVRLATSWATQETDIKALGNALNKLSSQKIS